MSERDELAWGRAVEKAPTTRGAVRRVLLVLAAFAVTGAVAGVVWERLWAPQSGVTYQDQWFLDPAGPDVSFQGIAWFVGVSFVLGLVLAVVAGVWRGHEVATLVAVTAGSVLAAVLMYVVGSALGPADPQVLAVGQPDFTRLPASLGLTAPDQGRVAWHSTALIAFPAGAMTGLVLTYLMGGTGYQRRSRG